MTKVAAIVPAYNEAPRIGAVLEVLTKTKSIAEIIVVDDGSTDGTHDIASRHEVTVLRNETNFGKGFAMDRGVRATSADIIFFCDADITGLTSEIVEYVIAPVERGAYDMFIAIHNRNAYSLPFLLRQTPHLGGERALRRNIWEELPPFFKKKFRIEAGLNAWAKHFGKGFGYHIFPELYREPKESKYGFFEGSRRRIGMAWDVSLAYVALLALKFSRLSAKVVR